MTDTRKKATRQPPRQPSKSDLKSKTIMIGACAGVIGAIIGGLIGHFAIPSGATNVNNVAKTTISPDATKQIAASYTYKGQTASITYDDVIKYLGTSANEDQSYDVPTAESCINLARQRIMRDHAKDEGVTVTEDDLKAYVKEQFGSESVEETAKNFGYEPDQIREMLNDSIVQKKLFDKVTENKAPKAPEYPSEPAEGKESEATKGYADYITKLAGDAWDASANGGQGGWKDPQGTYAISCHDYAITNDSATYEAAVAAYQAAYQDYSSKMSEFQTKWSQYMNQVYKDSPITLASLVQ